MQTARIKVKVERNQQAGEDGDKLEDAHEAGSK